MAKIISTWTKHWLSKKEISFYFSDFATSTNDLAKEHIFKSSDEPLVFLVGHQTKGRGSKNRRWENSDLMISFLFRKNLKEITASSCKDFVFDLCKSLQEVWPQLVLEVKAPNDLYLNQKKIAGLLLEVLNQGSKTVLIVGLGLNVFSCPKHLKAAYLAEQAKNINLQNWESFLNHLFFLWSKRASFLYCTDPV